MAHANFIESGETVTAQRSIPITGEEVIPEEIDLHSTLPTQTAIKGGKFQIINVQNAIERKGLISFRIVSGDNSFIDPYNTYVLITSSIKILKVAIFLQEPLVLIILCVTCYLSMGWVPLGSKKLMSN